VRAPVKRKTAKANDDSFTAFVIDQLRDLGIVEARRMFGGRGLYWKDQIFGLIDESRLYFRVSESTSSHYEAEGSRPFEPWPGHVMKSYYEVPVRILEDCEEVAAWAREAWSLPRSPARPRSRTGGPDKGLGAARTRGSRTSVRARMAASRKGPSR
jgi:DNA transformation protein and related proteins